MAAFALADPEAGGRAPEVAAAAARPRPVLPRPPPDGPPTPAGPSGRDDGPAATTPHGTRVRRIAASPLLGAWPAWCCSARSPRPPAPASPAQTRRTADRPGRPARGPSPTSPPSWPTSRTASGCSTRPAGRSTPRTGRATTAPGSTTATSHSATPGGLPSNPGTSIDNTGGRVVLGPQAVAAPAAYSIELWFRTTSTVAELPRRLRGRPRRRRTRLFGTEADRSVTMESTGRADLRQLAVAQSGASPRRAPTTTAPGTTSSSRATPAAPPPSTSTGLPVASGTTSTLLELLPGSGGSGRAASGCSTPRPSTATSTTSRSTTPPCRRPASRAHWAAR